MAVGLTAAPSSDIMEIRTPSQNEKGCFRNFIQLSNRSDFVNQGINRRTAARIKKPGVNDWMRNSSEESVNTSANPILTATLTGSSQSKRRTNFLVSKEDSFPIVQVSQSFQLFTTRYTRKNLKIRIGGNKGVTCLLDSSLRMSVFSCQRIIALQQLLVYRIPRMLHHQSSGVVPEPST